MKRAVNLLLPALFLAAALIPGSANGQTGDHEAIMETIKTFFDGFAEGDSTKMFSKIDRNGRLVITFNDENGQPGNRPIGLEEFVSMISRPREQPIKETFWNAEITVEDNLASVWVDYNLWVGDVIDHCGRDNFQLFRSTEGWKIIAIADTQQKSGCKPHEE